MLWLILLAGGLLVEAMDGSVVGMAMPLKVAGAGGEVAGRISEARGGKSLYLLLGRMLSSRQESRSL